MRNRLVWAALAGTLVCLSLGPASAAASAALPAEEAPLPVIRAISAGGDVTCALTALGRPLCWGNNRSGQLGDGTSSSVGLPNDIVGLPDPVGSIVPGTFHACALTTSGAVWCWGRIPSPVAGLDRGVASIAPGRQHTCAVTDGGAAKCWGANTKGQLGNGAATKYPIAAGVVSVVGMSSGVASIVSGDAYSCALTTAGAVKCWGDNQFGQLGDGTTARSWVPVDVVGLGSAVVGLAAGGLHVCAVLASGEVRCWGRNNYGQLGDGTNTDRLTPVAVQGLAHGATQLTAGVLHTCALVAGGGVMCWGLNSYGRLGLETPLGTRETEWSGVPLAVASLSTGVEEIAAGDGHTCARLAATVRCWGYNGYGQLGNGTSTSTDRGQPATVDFTVHPKLLNLSALGATETGAFTAPTKVAHPGSAVSWRAQTVPSRPGATIQAWIATKASFSEKWRPFSLHSIQVVDADGFAFATVTSAVPGWVSIRFVIAATGSDPALASFARPAHFR